MSAGPLPLLALPAEDEDEEIIVGSEAKTSVPPLDPPLGSFDPPPFPLPVDGRRVGSKAGAAVPSAMLASSRRRSTPTAAAGPQTATRTRIESFIVDLLWLFAWLWFQKSVRSLPPPALESTSEIRFTHKDLKDRRDVLQCIHVIVRYRVQKKQMDG